MPDLIQDEVIGDFEIDENQDEVVGTFDIPEEQMQEKTYISEASPDSLWDKTKSFFKNPEKEKEESARAVQALVDSEIFKIRPSQAYENRSALDRVSKSKYREGVDREELGKMVLDFRNSPSWKKLPGEILGAASGTISGASTFIKAAISTKKANEEEYKKKTTEDYKKNLNRMFDSGKISQEEYNKGLKNVSLLTERLNPNAFQSFVEKNINEPTFNVSKKILTKIEESTENVSEELLSKYVGTFAENPSFRRGFSALSSGVGSMAIAIPISVVAGPEAGAAILSMAEAGPTYKLAIAKGKTPDVAMDLAMKTAMATFFLEKFGLEKIIGSTGTKTARFLKGSLAEGSTEITQTIVQNAIQKHGIDDSIGYFDQIIEAGIGGLVGGPAAVMFGTNGEKPKPVISEVEKSLREDGEGAYKNMSPEVVDTFEGAKETIPEAIVIGTIEDEEGNITGYTMADTQSGNTFEVGPTPNELEIKNGIDSIRVESKDIYEQDIERIMSVSDTDLDTEIDNIISKIEGGKTGKKAQAFYNKISEIVSPEEADAVSTILDARAKAAGMTTDEYIERRGLDVEVGGEVGELQQTDFKKSKMSEVLERGESFKTGKPVTFNYAHNTESATGIFGIPDKDSKFGRGYEPSGKYMTVVGEKASQDPLPNIEYGTATFQNPLVIDNDNINWKKYLSEDYNGLTGKKLSKAIIADGYDGIVTTENGHTSEVVNFQTFDEAKALYQKQTGPTGTKASVTFEDTKTIIRAFESADVSSLIHELGHVFRRDLANEDLEIAENWAGVKDGNWTVKAEEKFARAFEKYLADGKAPIEELKAVFEQFKRWLTEIYSGIKGSSIDVKLTPEIKGVFDRLLTESDATSQADGVNILKQSEEQINSKAFKDWFGDSKVVDENGDPLVVYHGKKTKYDFVDTNLKLSEEDNEKYKKSRKKIWEEYFSKTKHIFEKYKFPDNPIGKDSEIVDEALKVRVSAENELNKKYGQGQPLKLTYFPDVLKGNSFDVGMSQDIGVHFTQSRDTASEIAGKGAVYPVYLKIGNLYRVSDIFSRERGTEKALDELKEADVISDDQYDSLIDKAIKADSIKVADERDWGVEKKVVSFWNMLNKSIVKNSGPDIGLVYHNEVEGGGDSYVVFNPNQIKSVFNQGTFDPTDPNILMQKEEELKTRVRRITGQKKDNTKTVSEREALKASFTKAAQAARKAMSEGNKEGLAKERIRMREIINNATKKRAAAKTVRDIKARIKRELKFSKVKKQSGKPVGKFTPEIQEILNKLISASKLKKDEAEQRIADNLMKYSDGLPPQDIVIENHFLEMVARHEGMNDPKQLQSILDEITALKNEGRLIKKLRDFNRQSKNIARVDTTVEELGGIPKGVTILGKKDFLAKTRMQKAKQALKSFGKSMMGWDDLMDILSGKTKSKPGESFISKDNDLLGYKNTEKRGIRVAMDSINNIYKKSYGLNSDRQVTNKINEDNAIDIILKKVSMTDPIDGTNFEIDLVFTKSELRKRAMELQDPSLEESFKEMGYNESTKAAIFRELSAQDKDFIKKQIEFYRKYYGGVNDIYKKMYGVNLPKNDFYTPISREGVSKQSQDSLGEFMQEMSFRASATSGSLKSRVGSTLTVSKQNDVSVLERHISEMEHFKAWAEKIRDLNAVWKDPQVRTAIEINHGTDLLAMIDTFISDIATGTPKTNQKLRGLDKLRINYTKSALAVQPDILIKQITSFVAYAEKMPVGEFVKNMTLFWKNPVKNYKEIMSSELMKERGKNIDRDLKQAMNSKEHTAFSKTKSFTDMLMLNVQIGDKGAIIIGGWPYYKYLKDSGMSHKEALNKFEKFTEQTQQSGDITEQSYWQRGGSLAKLFTMFASSPNQYFRKEIGAIRNLVNGRQGAKQTIKTLTIYHVLLPMLFQLASDRFTWDEEEQKRAMIFGALNGWFIVGDGLDFLLRKALGTQAYNMELPVYSIFHDFVKATDMINFMELGADEFFRAIRGVAGVAGSITGLPFKQSTDMTKGAVDVLSGEYEKGLTEMIGYSPYLADKITKE